MHTGFCFAVLCCGYTLTDFPISIRLTSLALWQFNDCPSASKATLMNMDNCFMWIHYERLHNHNKAKHNKTVCIFLGIYCICVSLWSISYANPWHQSTDFMWPIAKILQHEIGWIVNPSAWMHNHKTVTKILWKIYKPNTIAPHTYRIVYAAHGL